MLGIGVTKGRRRRAASHAARNALRLNPLAALDLRRGGPIAFLYLAHFSSSHSCVIFSLNREEEHAIVTLRSILNLEYPSRHSPDIGCVRSRSSFTVFLIRESLNAKLPSLQKNRAWLH